MRWEDERELILYCDESVKEGKYYSNFYGGVLVPASRIERINQLLNLTKEQLNLHREVKWQKVTEQYLEKYQRLMDVFLDLVVQDQIKMRVMFRQSAKVALGLSDEQESSGFYLLYYQFIKHAFGLQYRPHGGPCNLRTFFDQFPDTGAQVARFRQFVLGLNSSAQFAAGQIRLASENITEVRSHDHVILQCLDVVLGSMAFKLNDLHLAKAEGSVRRGKRTVAKDLLYQHIRGKLTQLLPNFNAGISTSRFPDDRRWTDSYRHWSFTPSDHEIDPGRFKP